MANPHGTPIWYELVTRDADAATAFYDEVLGWSVGERPAGEIDYRMIATADGNVGGVAGIGAGIEAEIEAGAPAAVTKPGWRFYIGVDDVDETARAITAAGGSIAMPPFDLPGVGRMALVADPQGIVFFIMTGAGPDDSRAFDRFGMGKCNWNELATADQAAANAFYAAVFGWRYPDAMTMPGDMGDYMFIDAGGVQIGATMTATPYGGPPDWRFYFRVPDIERAADRVRTTGGTVHMGPHEVPGGDRVVIASDAEGLPFGIVGPGVPA